MITKDYKKQGRQEGFALLLSLVVVVILTTLVVEVSYSSRVAATVAGNHRDGLKAYYLAKSGVDISLLRLEVDKIVDQLSGKKDDFGELHWSLPLAYPEGLALLTGALESTGITQEVSDQFQQQYDIGGSLQSEISDETAKININSMKINGTTPNGTFLLFQNLLFLEEFKDFFKERKQLDVIYNLIDWMDKDGQARGIQGGLEDYYYQSLPQPYHAKNGPFFSVGELRLVKEMDSVLLEALLPYVSVFPYSTTAYLGANYGKVNINTAPATVIAALFDRQQVYSPEELAGKITERREERPFGSTEDFYKTLESLWGVPKDYILKDIQSMLTVRSDTFHVKSVGLVNDSSITIEVVVDRAATTPEFFYWRVI